MTTGNSVWHRRGPGDPEWITVKAARLLSACRHIYVPKSRDAAESVALEIARCYLRPDAAVHELTFPMTADDAVLREGWGEAARQVGQPLAAGEDACFLTLGDALLYSTYIYLTVELRAIDPEREDRHRARDHRDQRRGGDHRLPHRPTTAACHDRAGLRRHAPVHGRRPGPRRHGGADEDRPPAGSGVGGVGIAEPAGAGGVRLPRRHAAAARGNRPAPLRGTPEQTGYLSLLIIQAGRAGKEKGVGG